MKRLFIASGLSAEFSSAVGGLVAGLKPAHPGVKWVEPSALHVTYSFLGDLPDGNERALVRSLRDMPPLKAFTASAGQLGVFPNDGPARVLWLGFSEGADGFRACAEAVRKAVSAASVFVPWREEFVPHLTLGRIKKKLPPGSLAAFRQACADFKASSPVTELALYESKLTPAGPEYSKLLEVQLK